MVQPDSRHDARAAVWVGLLDTQVRQFLSLGPLEDECRVCEVLLDIANGDLATREDRAAEKLFDWHQCAYDPGSYPEPQFEGPEVYRRCMMIYRLCGYA